MSSFDSNPNNQINENKEQTLISENPTLDYSDRKTDITPKREYVSKHFPFEKGRTKVICFGIFGILLIVIAKHISTRPGHALLKKRVCCRKVIRIPNRSKNTKKYKYVKIKCILEPTDRFRLLELVPDSTVPRHLSRVRLYYLLPENFLLDI